MEKKSQSSAIGLPSVGTEERGGSPGQLRVCNLGDSALCVDGEMNRLCGIFVFVMGEK